MSILLIVTIMKKVNLRNFLWEPLTKILFNLSTKKLAKMTQRKILLYGVREISNIINSMN